MASKTTSLSVEGVGGKTSEDGAADNGAGSKVSSPSSKQADRGDDRDGAVGAATGGEGKASDGGVVQEGKTSPARGGLAGTGATPAGESSTSSSGAGPIIVEAGGRRKGPNLVQRFVDFVFRVIHTEMDSFFTEHAKLFDQDWEDFNQQGETLEQFQCFKDYEKVLDTHLNRFATKEGYDNAPQCFMELERLVTEDAEEHKRRMAEMQENLRRQQEEYNAAQKSADAGDSAAPAAKQPLMIFFQPISLEQLMQMVLNMAEYPTFSFMMRMKVQQIKLMKAIREQMDAARRDAHMEVEDIELVEDNPMNNDADFATTTTAMDSAGGKSSPESNRK